MKTLVVRQAKESDVETLLTYSKALAEETEGRFLNSDTLRAGILQLIRDSNHGSFIVAEMIENGQPGIIGQLMITYEWSDWRNGEFWWVQSVYVHPLWRRQGIYRSMHAYILNQAKSDPNICGIRLYVEQNNQTAQTVYQQVGLSATGYIVYEEDFSLNRVPCTPKI